VPGPCLLWSPPPASYVWLRYSSIRQLTWQRNYNTQPRILSAAQERLTNAIASAHGRTTGEAQAGPEGWGGEGRRRHVFPTGLHATQRFECC
jgi:hypothetical protein